MEEKKELLDQDERVVEIELERLRGFVNHPFKVQADSQMIELQESIKKYGILNPLIVRPRQDGTYEIISGHRRKFAAEKIGYRTVIYRAVSHVRTFGSHLCDHQRTYGGDLSDGQSGTTPVCNLWKQGTEHDGPELYEKFVCTGISGIFDHGMCGNLCSPDPVSSIQHRYHCFVMEGYGLYDPVGIYLI